MRYIIFIISIFSFSKLYAQQPQIVKVSSAGVTTVFTDLKAAMNAANDDDMIYVPGGNFTIDSLNFRKKVHLIGTGHYPDSTLATGKTSIMGNIYRLDGGSNGSIQGAEVNGGVYFLGSGNFFISKSIFNFIRFRNPSAVGNIFISECIIKNDLSNYDENSSGHNSTTISVDKSIFRSPFWLANSHISNSIMFDLRDDAPWWTGVGNLYQCYNNSFVNNIFKVNYNGGSSLAGNNKFYNNHIENLSGGVNLGGTVYEEGTTYDDVLNSTFKGGACEGQFNYNFDYHIKPTSSAHNSGTDGTDRGIYGGTTPYNPNPYNPHISYKNIAPTTNAQGQLQIEVKVKAQ